jgi:hypothetical protein
VSTKVVVYLPFGLFFFFLFVWTLRLIWTCLSLLILLLCRSLEDRGPDDPGGVLKVLDSYVFFNFSHKGCII